MEAPQPPPPAKRLPSLKITSDSSVLSISAAGAPSTVNPSSSFQHSTTPVPATPSQGPLKIKLVSKSQPSTPADSHPPNFAPRPAPAGGRSTGPAAPKITQTKTGRVSKPSAKKRTRDKIEGDNGDVPLANGTALEPRAKKTKITLKPVTPGLVRQPTLKVKPVGRIPQKPLGEGYDSEAEDREVDPVIEEQFLFRMMPGEHCDYLHECVRQRTIGQPLGQGGADFQLKWLDDEGRRAIVTVKGQRYAAILLDLPTITEGMKTWDKKSMAKTADICQMLLVYARVESEVEAKTAPLPKAVERGHRWPHGITPPMHDARNRRFRKRLSKQEIRDTEAEVERLTKLDREAISVRTEWIENKSKAAADEEEDEEEEDYEEDAEGEMDDYFGDADMEQQLEEELEIDESALEAEFEKAVETPGLDLAVPGAALDSLTPGSANAGTPLPQTEGEDEAEGAEEEESDEEEEDDDDDGDEDGDEDEGDEQDETAGIRTEIAILKRQLKTWEDQLAASVQPIMRKRLEGNIKSAKQEIQLKMSAIGEVEED